MLPNAPVPYQIQPIQPQDQRAVLQLLVNARWKHSHLDWFDSQQVLNDSHIFTAKLNEQTVACLAAPEEPERVAWIRLFLVSGEHHAQPLWDLLWPHVRDDARHGGVDRIAVLSTTRWFAPILYQAGFTYETDVVFLERTLSHPPAVPGMDAAIRPMEIEDLPDLVRVDHRAFAPIWRHSLSALTRAYYQASHATVLDVEDKPAGYQISTSSMFGAHLARVAVDPDWQRRGLGKALVADTLASLSRQGYSNLSVNTQVDNLPSQRLYESLGFRRSGTRYPVLTQRLHPDMA